MSSFQGSFKFIEKGLKTIYIILRAKEEDIDFKEWGDVGWKGGSPRKTSYDEIGLTDWDAVCLYIPSYLKNDEDLIKRTILAQQQSEYLDNFLEIEGVSQDKIKKSELEIEEIGSSYNFENNETGFYEYLETMENLFRS